MLSPDERVNLWLSRRISRPLANSADLHYRDCPELVFEHVDHSESPLSEVTSDLQITFHARWGCKHGPRRFDAFVHEQGSFAELIDDLAKVEESTLTDPGNTFYSRHYPAPEKGTVYAPDRE